MPVNPKLTGSELLSLVEVRDGALVYATRRPFGRYQIGDPVEVGTHAGRAHYRIHGRFYRPDVLIKAVTLGDPTVIDTFNGRAHAPQRQRTLSQRDEEIAALLQQGLTLADIGARYGVSRQRVKQIAARVARAGVAANPKEARAAIKAKATDAANVALHGDKYYDIAAQPELFAYLKKRLGQIRQRAYATGVPFELTISDVVPIPTVCPALGIPIYTAGRGRGDTDNSLSFDRIDPTKGYVKGNVILVSQRANRIKNDATPDELRRLADFYASAI